jgi:hypothetical protein
VLDTVSLSVEEASDADVVPTAVNLLPELAEVPTQGRPAGGVLLDAHMYGVTGCSGRACRSAMRRAHDDRR